MTLPPHDDLLESFLYHLRIVVSLHEQLDPRVPKDCVDQLPQKYQQWYADDRGVLRRMLMDAEERGARMYSSWEAK